MITEQKPARASYDEVVNALRALRKDIDDLVNHSQGVAGLHMNGDIAEWDSLLPGGSFENWMLSVSDADEVLARVEIPADPQPAPLTAEALADALGCFWNAAITAAHNARDPVAMSVASVTVEGFAAVANRLMEVANG
ncbi:MULTISPECIES: hypothetical protein [unclassified Novosphingobium]|uniref:hypothetical protein n=1 Tax=unclassified Novosphingobium TaxID=2644732 RepID=UPI000D30791D|nr:MULTISPECIES: hypothetical protein [unclassified Novosphingobium]PTR05381.1 hypothetical protein C8K11_1348 [Novosphingobium sp. GV055]PUA93945.1 hypothetical protein C8K12_1348 [Novosphingobium sp. GV061]PUB11362.1 hypothetical protein C8K14_1348 [Novosphingobium sp. GV079]PUB37052.1 hypothetical protein C8K10_1348 [Novosphingobium sp. GV027]